MAMNKVQRELRRRLNVHEKELKKLESGEGEEISQKEKYRLRLEGAKKRVGQVENLGGEARRKLQIHENGFAEIPLGEVEAWALKYSELKGVAEGLLVARDLERSQVEKLRYEFERLTQYGEPFDASRAEKISRVNTLRYHLANSLIRGEGRREMQAELDTLIEELGLKDVVEFEGGVLVPVAK